MATMPLEAPAERGIRELVTRNSPDFDDPLPEAFSLNPLREPEAERQRGCCSTRISRSQS
jgi:hypothetical protein